MSWLAILVLCGLVGWLFVRRNEASEQLDRIEARLNRLEFDLEKIKRPTEPVAPLERAATTPSPEPAARPARATPPPIPPILEPQLQPQSQSQPEAAAVPPVLPPLITPMRPRPARAAINWEKFLGVKMFSWIGGFVLFLAVAFFIKFAFEKNWITPGLRVMLGYVVGLGLLLGGLFMPRERQPVTVQTLCATGIVVLYGNIFSSHAFYHFIGTATALALMALVTASAFVIAVKLNAQVVAVLGLLGGFLTPKLLSTGVDHPVGLFGYLALLDIGLLAVALRQRWNYLALLGAVSTILMQCGWVATFFEPHKNLIAMTVFLGFAVLFTLAFGAAHKFDRLEKYVSASAILMPASALFYALYVLGSHPTLARAVVPLFTFVFLADLLYLAMASLRDEMRPAQAAAGGAVFLLLSIWTTQHLSDQTLNAGLVFILLFAVVHAVFPAVLQRLRPARTALWWMHLYPSLALVLILIPLFKDTELSWLMWPVVLGIDLIAIGLAIMAATLTSILAVFLLTALLTGVWIMQTPPVITDVPGFLTVIGGFAVFFMGAALFAARKVSIKSGEGTAALPPAFGQIAALSGALPFLLLILVSLRLPLSNPSTVFGLAALLVALMLGALQFFRLDWFAYVALISTLLLEQAWHFARFNPAMPAVPLAWYAGFSLAFLIFPFLFQARLQDRILPWAAAACSLPAHFYLIYRTIKVSYPDFTAEGLIPAALALPCLAALTRLLLTVPRDHPLRNSLFALFGGASLFFITLIFPIQFERHWITIGWALEGAALLWLFHRVPHPGLRLVGVGLLVTGFVRLALNPWVLTEYERTGIRIWNWYLYTYGIVAVCLFLGARLLAPPRNKIQDLNVPPLLYTFGTILAFLLLNIEIADFFSDPGPRLTFNFSASFAQDMVYSLAWALFAFVLLAIGFKIENKTVRYAGMGLLLITLVKLFLHDLFRLGGLYRIGSLIGLAVVLIVVSLIYQRFLSSDSRRRTAAAE